MTDMLRPSAGQARPGADRPDPYNVLAARSRVLRDLERRHGRPDPFHWASLDATGDSRFAGLLLHIVSQQISTAVALRMFTRIEATTGSPPTPDDVLTLDVEGLRGCGLSHAKAASLLDVARRVHDGSLALDQLDTYADEDVVARLTAARGIGPWTAQMFLIHQLRRPDILPAGDLGIRQAVRTEWHHDTLPAQDEVVELGRSWAPYRTYAAALLWTSLRQTRR